MGRSRTLFATIIVLTLIGATMPSALRSEEAAVHRFLILGQFQGEAVLDRETQLIWERAPNSIETRWGNAALLCAMRSIGGQRGWRLPTFFELMTLVDPAGLGTTNRSLLPEGNPFTGIGKQPYWSSNTQTAEPTNAYVIDFVVGDVATQHKHSAHRIWCVRSSSTSSNNEEIPGSRGKPSLVVVLIPSV
jgi:Protein of unknown function (DUF1566)